MNSRRGITPYRVMGCPIRRSSDLRSVCTSPTLFAAAHVLLRHSTPRHPPHAIRPSSSRPPSRQPAKKATGWRCLVHAVVITLHHSAAIEGNSRMDASLWYDPPLALLVTDPGADRTGTRRVVSSTVKVPHSPHPVPRACPARRRTDPELALQFRPQPLSIPECLAVYQHPRLTHTTHSHEPIGATARRSVFPTSLYGAPYSIKSGLGGATDRNRSTLTAEARGRVRARPPSVARVGIGS
jgi:hypothetical protein